MRAYDEFTKVTGCHRKAAIRLIRGGNQTGTNKRRGRPRQYGAGVAGAPRVMDWDERCAMWKELSLLVLEKAPGIGLPEGRAYLWWWPWLKNYYGEVDPAYYSAGALAARMWLDEDLKKELGF